MAEAAQRRRPRGRDQAESGREPGDETSLSAGERRFLVVLAAPALALALTATTVTAYLPLLIQELAGPLVTGALIGMEGLLALTIPVAVGSRSDRTRTRLGARLPFMLAAAPVAALALVLMPLAGSLLLLGPLIFVFFAAYFTYYPPYRALYPDLVPDRASGRSQAAQKTLREAGLVAALVGGGLLISVWRPLPFAIGAVVLLAATGGCVWLLRDRARRESNGDPTSSGGIGTVSAELLRDPRIRWLAIANGLWELALGAIKTFVVLFFTVGLGRSTAFASAVLAGAAVAIIAAALIGGTLGDRIGHGRLLRVAAWVYGIGLLAPLISQSPVVLAAVPPIAFAGGIVMTLPFAVLMELMPEERHGAASGLFEVSRGVGTLLGPLLAGVAITLAQPVLESTDGYAAMWAVASGAVLLGMPALGRLRSAA